MIDGVLENAAISGLFVQLIIRGVFYNEKTKRLLQLLIELWLLAEICRQLNGSAGKRANREGERGHVTLSGQSRGAT